MTEKNIAVARIRAAANLPEKGWSEERIEAVQKMCAPEAKTVHELAMFLSTAQRYDLDPMQKEIWLGQLNGKPAVIVGRDGYLKVANRDPHFLGFQADVVRENDEFRVVREGAEVRVHHTKQGFSGGKIVGAYALIHRQGKDDVYYDIPWSELSHLHNRAVWKQHPSQMILTRALTFALKLAYNLSGVYSAADEFTEDEAAAFESESVAQATKRRLAEIKEGLTVKVEPEFVEPEVASGFIAEEGVPEDEPYEIVDEDELELEGVVIDGPADEPMDPELFDERD